MTITKNKEQNDILRAENVGSKVCERETRDQGKLTSNMADK